MGKSIMWLALILVMTFPNIGYSCKCNLSRVEQFAKSPVSAPIVLVGKLVKSSEKQYLKLIKSWTVALDETRLGTGNDCSFTGLKMGANYLLLSEKSANSTYADHVNECDAILVEFTPQNVSLIDQLAKKKDFVGEINPSWQYCESDSECMLSKDQCESAIGVNKKYEKDYLSFLKTKKAKLDCSKVEMPKSSVLKCVDSFCG